MKKLIVANWKCNPDVPRRAKRLAQEIERGVLPGVDVVIAPPFIFLSDVQKVIRKTKLGAQDVFWEDLGPYTGEVSPRQLRNEGVSYVIVGHSERRRHLYETDEMVNKKILAAHRAGLKVILCVGESWDVRRKGLGAAKSFVLGQLKKDLKGVSKKNLVVAYEPIWAIGTGKADKPEETVQMSRMIKGFARVPVLYGGSVNSQNAKNFLQYKEINGALVGGASLKPVDFKKIIKIASR